MLNIESVFKHSTAAWGQYAETSSESVTTLRVWTGVLRCLLTALRAAPAIQQPSSGSVFTAIVFVVLGRRRKTFHFGILNILFVNLQKFNSRISTEIWQQGRLFNMTFRRSIWQGYSTVYDLAGVQHCVRFGRGTALCTIWQGYSTVYDLAGVQHCVRFGRGTALCTIWQGYSTVYDCYVVFNNILCSK
jgi:hypothetical protein